MAKRIAVSAETSATITKTKPSRMTRMTDFIGPIIASAIGRKGRSFSRAVVERKIVSKREFRGHNAVAIMKVQIGKITVIPSPCSCGIIRLHDGWAQNLCG